MKKLLFLLITLITFNNVSYASFPVEDEFNVSNFIEFTEIADNSCSFIRVIDFRYVCNENELN